MEYKNTPNKRRKLCYNFKDVAQACGYTRYGFIKKLKRLGIATDISFSSIVELTEFVLQYRKG